MSTASKHHMTTYWRMKRLGWLNTRNVVPMEGERCLVSNGKEVERALMMYPHHRQEGDYLWFDMDAETGDGLNRVLGFRSDWRWWKYEDETPEECE